MSIYEEAYEEEKNLRENEDREREAQKREWHFRPIDLPEVIVPKKGLSDWFDDGIEEIIEARNRDHAQDSSV